MKILTIFYRRVIVVARYVDDTTPKLNPRFSIAITQLTKETLPVYIQLRPDQDLNVIQTRLTRGDQCIAVWHEGRMVHVGWVATGPIYESYLRRELILQPGDIFLYDHYTQPSHRSCGLAQTRDIHVLGHYRGEGYRRSIAIVAVENRAGFRPFMALGYRPIGMFKCLRFGPWQWDREERWGEELLPTLTKMKL